MEAEESAAPRVLVISRSYPSSGFPTMGIFVERLTELAAENREVSVICPVPWAPPLPFDTDFDRYRRVERRRTGENGVRVEYPRVPAGPGYLLHAFDTWLQHLPVRRTADRMREEVGFDLIHAHIVHPEGVLAARLGRRYDVPVVVSEHAMWKPWLDDYPLVRREVLSALDDIQIISVPSQALRRQVQEIAPGEVETRLLPNVIDERIFTPPDSPDDRDPNRLLFVGTVRRVKGLDVLVRALPQVFDRHPDAHLRVVGEPFRRSYREDERAVRGLVDEMGLGDRVEFVGGRPPEGVAEEMRRAAALVVPSRRESFATVVAEALACGTPVVATRCGGPEEILTEETGLLAPTEDPPALADAIDDLLAGRRSFSPDTLRSHALDRYGREATRARIEDLYGSAIEEAEDR